MVKMDVSKISTIAVDFDGTLCYSRWPNKELIDYLVAWKQRGNKLILWTCREGTYDFLQS